MAKDRGKGSADAEKQLQSFIDKFEPKHAALIRGARKQLRRQFPSAHELIYDNYNFFVIGYSPTEKPSDSLVSIAAAANGVGLCFIRGASLPDPKKILLGSGKQTRFVRLESVDVLSRPEVVTLLAAAAAHSKAPLSAKGAGRLIIRSSSAKQKPRRKPASATTMATSKGARKGAVTARTQVKTREDGRLYQAPRNAGQQRPL
jgi:Domain of unknown function (DU1801)